MNDKFMIAWLSVSGLFIALKLFGITCVSWWQATMTLWLPIVVAILVMAGCLTMLSLAEFINRKFMR